MCLPCSRSANDMRHQLIMHTRKQHVSIWQVTLVNDMHNKLRQHASVVSCAHRLGNFSHDLSVSTRLYHLRSVRISKATSANKREQQPRPTRISRGVCVMTHGNQSQPMHNGQETQTNGRQHHPRSQQFCREMCAPTTRLLSWLAIFHLPMAGTIKTRSTRILHGLCTSFNLHRTVTCRIIKGTFT